MVTITLTETGVDVAGTDHDGTHAFNTGGTWTSTLHGPGGAIRVMAWAGDKVVHYTADGQEEFPAWSIEGDGTTELRVDIDVATLAD